MRGRIHDQRDRSAAHGCTGRGCYTRHGCYTGHGCTGPGYAAHGYTGDRYTGHGNGGPRRAELSHVPGR
jgi:hypothetical protein